MIPRLFSCYVLYSTYFFVSVCDLRLLLETPNLGMGLNPSLK